MMGSWVVLLTGLCLGGVAEELDMSKDCHAQECASRGNLMMQGSVLTEKKAAEVGEYGRSRTGQERTTRKAVIYHGSRKDQPVAQYMYEPFVKTIKSGFTHKGLDVVVPTPGSDLETTLTTLVSGDILVFVGGIGKGTFLDVMHTDSTASLMTEDSSESLASAAIFRDHARRYNFGGLRSSGVKVIYYNTDAAFECPLTSADPVNELWDYSHHNIDVCEEQGNGPTTIRYVPPGYLTPDAPSSTTLFGPHGSLFFLGNPWRTHWKELYNLMPGQLDYKGVVWTSQAMQGILITHDIFLTLGKGMSNWTPRPFDAASVSRFLSAGGILISDRAYGKDETAFAGMVDFEEVEKIPSKYAQYKAEDSVTFDKVRASRRAIFQTNFAPSVLFSNAGVYTMLDAKK